MRCFLLKKLEGSAFSSKISRLFILLERYPIYYLVACLFLLIGFEIASQAMFVVNFSSAIQVSISTILLYNALIIFVSLVVNYLSFFFIIRYSRIHIIKFACLCFILADAILFVLLNAHVFKHYLVCFYLISMMLQGLSLGLLYPVLNNIVLDSQETQKMKAALLSFFNALWNVGYFFSGMFFAIFSSIGCASAMYVILAMFFVIVLTFNVGDDVHRDSSFTKNTKAFSFFRLSNSVLLAGFLGFIVTYSQSVIEYWFPVFLHVNLHFTATYIGMFSSLFALGQFLGRIVIGYYVLPKVNLNIFLLSMLFLLGVLVYSFTGISICALLGFIVFMIGIVTSCLIPVVMSMSCSDTPALTSSYLVFMNTFGSITSFFVISYFSNVTLCLTGIRSVIYLFLVSLMICLLKVYTVKCEQIRVS